MPKASDVTIDDCRIIAELISKAFRIIDAPKRSGLIALYEDFPYIEDYILSKSLCERQKAIKVVHDIVVDKVASLGIPIVYETEYALAKQKNDRTSVSCLVHLRYRDLSAFKYYDAVVNYTVTETKIIVKITRNKLGESGIVFEAERSK